VVGVGVGVFVDEAPDEFTQSRFGRERTRLDLGDERDEPVDVALGNGDEALDTPAAAASPDIELPA
jgi:hypothetical protein